MITSKRQLAVVFLVISGLDSGTLSRDQGVDGFLSILEITAIATVLIMSASPVTDPRALQPVAFADSTNTTRYLPRRAQYRYSFAKLRVFVI